MRKSVVAALACVLAGGMGVAVWLGTSGSRSPTGAKGDGAAPAGEDAPPRVVRVTGGGKALAGATVRVTTRSRPTRATAVATTDGEGRAQVQVPARSVWGLVAFAQGFRPYEWRGEQFRDGVLEIALEPGIAFGGTVQDAETGTPITGASVVLHDGGTSVEVGPTGADGRFRVPGVRDDAEASVFVSAPGYADGEMRIAVDGGKARRGEPVVRLTRAWALEGSVKTPDGVPVAGARVCVGPDRPPPAEVEAWRSDEDRLEYYTQDDVALLRHAPREACADAGADGAFRVDGLSYASTYQAVAAASGHAASSPVRELALKAPTRSRSVVLSLRAPTTVLVDVFGPAGARVPEDARVRLFGADEMPRRPAGREWDGRLRFVDVEPGVAHVFVNAAGFLPAVSRIDVREGASMSVEMALDGGGVVDGVIVDPDGRPLEEAVVEIAPASRNPEVEGRFLNSGRTFETDAEGRFWAPGLERGPSLLVAGWRKDFRSDITLVTRKPLRLSVPARGVRVVLGRLGAVGMRLLTPDGKPFAGNVSMWLQYSAGGMADVRQVKDGVVTVEGLDDGWYRLVVVPEGLAFASRLTWVENGAPVDFGDVTVDAGVPVSGRVVDAAGRPLAGARVVCREFSERETVTDGDGRFSFARFPRERFVLLATAGGTERGALVVEPGATAGLEIRASRPAVVRGRVTDAVGAAQQARLTLALPGTSPPRSAPRDGDDLPGASSVPLTASADGRFEREVPPGRWVGWWRDGKGEDRRVGEWTFSVGGTYDLEIVLPR